MSGEERLILVTDFGSLRQGDLVVVCDRDCGGRHRGILLYPEVATVFIWGRVENDVPTFELHPQPSCRPAVAGLVIGAFSVCPSSVAAKVVYRVDTGLGSAEEAERDARTPNEDLAARAGRQSGKTLGAYERYHAYRKAIKP
jgi:hypothetical protein